MTSYHCNMIGPDDQVDVLTSRFDPNSRFGGLGHEEYALFHGWEVGPHAAGSGKCRKKRLLWKSIGEFPNPLDIKPIGQYFGDWVQPDANDY